MTATRRGLLLKDLEPADLVMALDLWRDERGTEPPDAADGAAAGYLKGATAAQVCALADRVGARAVLAPAGLSSRQAVTIYRQGHLAVWGPGAFAGPADVLARRKLYLRPEDGPGQGYRVVRPVVAFDLELLAFLLCRTVSVPGRYLVTLPGRLADYPTLWHPEAAP